METGTLINIEEVKADILNIENAIAVSIDESEKEGMRNILAELQSQLEENEQAEVTPEPVQIITEPVVVEAAPLVVEPVIEIKNEISLSNNDYYENNPDKVLGEISQEKDRFGKPIDIVKGNITNLQKVDLDYSFIKDYNTSTSIISEIQPEENVVAVENIIEKSEKNIAKKSVTKKRKAVEIEPSLAPNMQSFEETYNQYNKDISLEELRVFIWYKQQIGQPLNDKWDNLAAGENEEWATDNWVTEKVKEGLLYYYNGSLLPAYLYLAENIYEKYIRLVKQQGVENAGQDAEHIISTYGQSVYDNQVSALNDVYKTLYEQRLVIGKEGEVNTLKLVPYSDFCKNFMIKTLIDEVPFKAAKVTASKHKDYGKPDFLKYTRSEWDKKEFDEFSLTDAFSYWLAKEKNNIVFKKGVSYADIIKIYINQGSMPRVADDEDKAAAKAEWERKKEKTRAEGERIFNIFLTEQLTINDKVRLEITWNRSFNNYVPINFNKVPIAFSIAKDFEVKPEKRDAVSFLFNNGSGCLAYDVGTGKTIASICILRQYIDSGYCRRPMVIVPNQTYRQWLSEIRKVMPDIKINDLYNLGMEYQEELWDENNKVSQVKENSITVLTYEGLEKLGFNEHTESEIFSQLYDILNQGGVEENISEKKSEKNAASFRQKLEKLIGRGLKNSLVNIEDIGTDFICFDEAHALKKCFTSVKGEAEEGSTKRGKTPYKLNSGTPSATALKGFMMSQYVLRNNNYRNILLLTATPFTNSPLEIFSMLSLVAYKQLQDTNLNSITNFFDNYIEMKSELVVTANMKAEYRQIVTGFRNITSLQSFIFRFFDYKDENNIPELKTIRPAKWVLPLTSKVVEGTLVKLNENERVETFLPLSDLQESLMKDIIAYSEGKISEAGLSSSTVDYIDDRDEDESAIKDLDALELSSSSMDEDEKKGVRIIKSIMFSQNLALSPYLYRHSGLTKPTYLDYVHTSPKLQYVMECIKSVKKYHDDNKEPVSGQIIYMNRGIEYFHLLKQYLVEVVGYQPHEVGLMYSQMKGGKEAKDNLKNLFLGIKYNPQIKTFEKISDEERVKVIIGSGTIKEGMNLQMKTTVLYNCFLDWNPTDILQLHGRLHRQGNEFKNVRIVNPLMINSVDIFLFQKLSEKTTRINQIWKTGNKTSVLKLEELNPSELKFALIKDPNIIATYELQDENARLEDDMASEKSLTKKFENIIEYQKQIEMYRENADELIKEYRPKKLNDELTDDQRIKIVAEVLRTQTDENGLKMFQPFYTSEKEEYKKKGLLISEKTTLHKPYWFDETNLANRTINREEKDYFTPRGLNIKYCTKYIKEQENKIKEIEERIAHLNSKENLAILVEEVIERKKKDKIVEKTLPEIVAGFEKLNYLLSIKFDSKDTDRAQAEEFNCLVVDNNKEIRTDNEAIDHLEECISKLPSTKSIFSVDEQYTEERTKIHQQIYEKYQSKKKCVDNPHPIAILTGGSPASGKTSFLKHYAPYLLSDKLYKIDADEVRAELPENKGWNSPQLHDEIRDIMRNYLLSDENIGKPCKFDIIYDGTMNSTKNYLPLIGTLKRLGYKVFIIYIDKVTYDMAIARSLERFKHGEQHRYVPRAVIADFFQKGTEALEELKTKVDGYIVVDGSNREYNVIETGGEPLPSDREFSEGFTGVAKAKHLKAKKEKVEAVEIEKQAVVKEKEQIADTVDAIETLKTMISAYETSLKYTRDEAKKAEIQTLLTGTRLSLKYKKI